MQEERTYLTDISNVGLHVPLELVAEPPCRQGGQMPTLIFEICSIQLIILEKKKLVGNNLTTLF